MTGRPALRLVKLLLAWWLAVMATSAGAGTYIISPDRDSFMKADKPDENYGTGNELTIKSGKNDHEWAAIYGFSPSAIPPLEVMKSAVLRLWITRSDSDLATVHRVTDVWTETTVTYGNTGSDYDPTQIASFVPSPAQAFVDVDVTGLVRGWLDGSIANNGLSVRAQTGLDTRFTSREWGTPSELPQLVITTVPAPVLTVVKSNALLSDPLNGSSDPKAIPGAVLSYRIAVSNSGAGEADDGSTVVTEAVPPNVSLFVRDLAGAGSGPVAFTDGAPSSGLTYSYVSLSNSTDSIAFSNDGVSFNNVPTPDAEGYDPTISHFRVLLAGKFLGNSGAGATSFQLELRTKVKD